MKYLQTIKKNDEFTPSHFIPNTSNMLIIAYERVVESHNMYNTAYSRLNKSLWKKLYSLPDKLDRINEI